MTFTKYVYAPHTKKPYGSTLPITGKRQLEVLAFIKIELEEGRRFPSPEAIRDHMGWKSTANAYAICARFAREGKLIRLQERGWAWKLA